MRTLDYIELLFANRSSKNRIIEGRGLFYSVSAPDVLIRGDLSEGGGVNWIITVSTASAVL